MYSQGFNNGSRKTKREKRGSIVFISAVGRGGGRSQIRRQQNHMDLLTIQFYEMRKENERREHLMSYLFFPFQEVAGLCVETHLVCSVPREYSRDSKCKLLRSPRINSEESIPPAYVTWQAGTTNRVIILGRQATWAGGIDSWAPCKFKNTVSELLGLKIPIHICPVHS